MIQGYTLTTFPKVTYYTYAKPEKDNPASIQENVIELA